MKAEDFKSTIYEGGKYVSVLIETKPCACCGKRMIKQDRLGEFFPRYFRLTQEAQMGTAGLVYQTKSKVNNEPICNECEVAGKASFVCALCQQEKPSMKRKESFGDPAEHLCFDCYEVTPAMKWDETVNALTESHRYDFE